MRKRVICAMMGASLLPGLGGCAEKGSMMDKDPGGTIIVIALLTPLAIVELTRESVEDANSPPGKYTPSPDKLWNKAGVSKTEMESALARCGYQGQSAPDSSGFAERMAQSAACMEQAGYRYTYSTSKERYRMFNAGAAQDLSYAGICRYYAKYHIPACRKGAKLRAMSNVLSNFISYCSMAKNKEDIECRDYTKKREECADPKKTDSSNCSAQAFGKVIDKNIHYFFNYCDGHENDKSKPECHP